MARQHRRAANAGQRPATVLPPLHRTSPMPPLIRHALAVMLSGALVLPTACVTPQVPPAGNTLSTAQARKELDRLYDGLQSAHYDLFARRPRAQYDVLYRRVRGE